MVNIAHTKIIDISKDTFEAWRKGKKMIKEFKSCANETYTEEDFIDNEEICQDVMNTAELIKHSDMEYMRKRLNAVNYPEIKEDLIYIISKYETSERWWDNRVKGDGSYLFFLRYYLRLSEFGIPRRRVREEYVDSEEWEFMKDADEYAIVKQNPHIRVEEDEKNIKITMWG
jgi:hypothetical protein